jgi:peptidoglycan hydrolase-like protein with peptidoglycan-binding domain
LGVTLDTPKSKLTSPAASSASSTTLAVCFVQAIDLQNKNPSEAYEKKQTPTKEPQKNKKEQKYISDRSTDKNHH